MEKPTANDPGGGEHGLPAPAAAPGAQKRRLEALALVKRLRMGEDQCAVLLQLSAKGKKILRLAPRPLVGILQQSLADLPRHRLDSVHADLGEVIRLMKFKDVKARSTPFRRQTAGFVPCIAAQRHTRLRNSRVRGRHHVFGKGELK